MFEPDGKMLNTLLAELLTMRARGLLVPRSLVVCGTGTFHIAEFLRQALEGTQHPRSWVARSGYSRTTM